MYSLAAKALNPSAQVIAFEPARRTINYLKQNIEANDFDIITENIALSDKGGRVIFYDTVVDHQTSASLNPDKIKNNNAYNIETIKYEVETDTFDNYQKVKGIKKN